MILTLLHQLKAFFKTCNQFCSPLCTQFWDFQSISTQSFWQFFLNLLWGLKLVARYTALFLRCSLIYSGFIQTGLNWMLFSAMAPKFRESWMELVQASDTHEVTWTLFLLHCHNFTLWYFTASLSLSLGFCRLHADIITQISWLSQKKLYNLTFSRRHAVVSWQYKLMRIVTDSDCYK